MQECVGDVSRSPLQVRGQALDELLPLCFALHVYSLLGRPYQVFFFSASISSNFRPS
eukprot:c25337_g5_i1 orf=2-169(-)